MADSGKSASPLTLDTFGDLLKYLRRRAQLTQRELAIAVGYSEAHLSRLERNERLPDLSTLAALFVPALGLEKEPETIAHLLELAAIARGESDSTGGRPIITGSFTKEIVEIVETIEIPSNLPLPLTSFIGRETEIEEIKRLLQGEDSVRLLTLLGAGGSGKTRLALHVATQIVDGYPDGAWFVDLSPITDLNLIPLVTASTLGIADTYDQEITKHLITFLRSKKILIIFDNCEHLVTAISHLSESILRACPSVQIVATSREILNVPGEKRFQISPLPIPPEGESSQRGLIESYDSVHLFVQRAKSVQSSFELTDNNASSIAQICRRLDGMPLAIELAAARVGLLRVQQIEEQLKDRFNLLTSGNRTLPRHQTLRAMLDWHHDLLSETERKFFRRLSVFAGGWTLEAADEVVNEDKQTSTLDLLSHLADKSFIVAERQPEMEARYMMLETLREYAREKLDKAEEVSKFQQRHFDYFLNFAERAIIIGSQKSIWLNRLEAEQDNFRASLNWSLEFAPPKHVDKGILLLGLLADYAFYRGYVTEMLDWFDKLFSFDLPPTRGRALGFQKAGFLTRVRGDFDKAVRLLEQSLSMAREVGDKERAGWALLDLGTAARDTGKAEAVIPDFSEALSLFQEVKHEHGMLNSYYQLADTYMQRHEIVEARSFWDRGLELARNLNDKSFIAWGLEGLANAAFLAGQATQAKMLHIESLHCKVEVMDKAGMAYSFEGLAQAAALNEEPERATILWGAAEQLRTIMNTPLDPSRRDIYTSLIPTVRAQWDEKLFGEAWAKGQNMKIEKAITYALTSSND